MPSIIKKILLILLLLLIAVACFLFVGKVNVAEDITWGATFSQKHTELLGLDWQETYIAILDDLKADHVKLIAYWDMIEYEKDKFDFSGLDFQIEEAEKRNAKVLLTIGKKVPRWPECHIPEWARSEDLNAELLEYLETMVLRYRDSDAIYMWQVENEPFFPFGECPLPDREFLKQEIQLVKSLDDRPVLVTESGELPLWFSSAKIADVVGHTLYRKVWNTELKIYISYPLSPTYYARKGWLVKTIFNKKVICSELQVEPWSPTLMYDSTLEEQRKTMNLERFKNVIEFARNTGEDEFHLWGPEWWYWMKTRVGNDEIWEEAKKLWQ